MNTTINIHQTYKHYAPVLQKFGGKMGLNEEESADLTSRTFTTFIQIADRFEGRSSLKTFLIGIFRNKCREYFREETKNRARASFYKDDTESLEESFISKEREALLEEYINALPKKQMEVIKLKILNELSGEQIAKYTGLSHGNVRQIYSRAKENLKKSFSQVQ